MTGWDCHKCVFARVDSDKWLRCHGLGEPMLIQCANHPFSPSELREVPGARCPNFRAKVPEPKGEVKRISLVDGFYALVDADDYEWLNQYTWHLCGGGYAARAVRGTQILMHREIMDAPKGKFVDHIDGNRANNCRANLRICTQNENMRNQGKRPNATSPFKGVYIYRRTGKWCAKLQLNGKSIWLGYFDDEVEAARAYDRAAVEYFGEFARLNFPEEWPEERRAEVRAQRKDRRKGRCVKA